MPYVCKIFCAPIAEEKSSEKYQSDKDKSNIGKRREKQHKHILHDLLYLIQEKRNRNLS